ncbi:MAG: hypothetical protein DHS20C15_06640 [Planctomycetota bacterium]|nr:MAG: hypothetical protein DHS20C15_06640 [Planctomycetota bacterium]
MIALLVLFGDEPRDESDAETFQRSSASLPDAAPDQSGAEPTPRPDTVTAAMLDAPQASSSLALPGGVVELSVRVVFTGPEGGDRPVAATEVVASAHQPMMVSGFELTRRVTDGEGRATLSIPWALVESAHAEVASRLLITARVAPSMKGTLELPLPSAPRDLGEHRLEVPLQADIEVLVLRADGQPAAGQSVNAYQFVDGLRKSRGANFFSDQDGSARFQLEHSGSYRFFSGSQDPRAGGWGNGSGVTPLIELSVDAPPSEPIVLRLGGEGVMRGRVVDATGQPMRDVVLHLRHENAPLLGPNNSAERLAAFLAAPGLPIVMGIVTDADGRFEITGLRAGRFWVRGSFDRFSFSAKDASLTDTPVPADGRELELIFGAPLLAVRLNWESDPLLLEPPAETSAASAESAVSVGSLFELMGSPRSKVQTATRERIPQPSMSSSGSRLQLTELPDVPLLIVVRRSDSELLGSVRDDDPPPALTEGTDSKLFEVEPGATYLVGVAHRLLPWRPLEVHIPNTNERVDVTLNVPSPAPLGAVLLDVRDHLGAPVAQSFNVHVFDEQSGAAILEFRNTHATLPEPLRLELQAGAYRVLVEGTTFPIGAADYYPARRFGGDEVLVDVRAGEESSSTVTLGLGARLHVSCSAAPDDADRTAARGFVRSPEEVEFVARTVRLTLMTPARWRTPVLFGHRSEDIPAGAVDPNQRWLDNWIHSSTPATSEVLTPGLYTLVATLPGGRELRREIELFDGVTTEVTLDFR